MDHGELMRITDSLRAIERNQDDALVILKMMRDRTDIQKINFYLEEIVKLLQEQKIVNNIIVDDHAISKLSISDCQGLIDKLEAHIKFKHTEEKVTQIINTHNKK